MPRSEQQLPTPLISPDVLVDVNYLMNVLIVLTIEKKNF